MDRLEQLVNIIIVKCHDSRKEKSEMTKIATWVLPLLIVSLLVVSCTDKESKDQQTNPSSYTAFAGKRLGVITGAISDQVAQESVKAIPVYYTESSAAIEDVRKGRIDGFVINYLTAGVIISQEGAGDLERVEIPADLFAAPMGAISLDQNMIDRLNVFIAKIKSDGTYDDMQVRWIDNIPDLDSPMPEIDIKGGNGTLHVATTADMAPYAYIGANEEMKGYSVEFARRFAAHEGMNIEFAEMEFGGLIPYIVARKADFAVADISITEERKKSVLFTDSIHDDQLGIIALTQGSAPQQTTLEYTDFEGKNIGVLTGSVWDGVVKDVVKANSIYYSDMSAGIEDTKNGRIDGAIINQSTMHIVADVPGNEGLQYTLIPPEFYTFSIGFVSMEQDSINRFNTFLAEIAKDGTLASIQQYWLIESPDLDAPMKGIPKSSEKNGTLKVAASATQAPYVYVGDNDEMKGYCIELILRFAAWEGKKIEILNMDFSGLIPYIISKKAEFGVADFAMTPERKKSVLFTDSIFDETVDMMYILSKSETATVARRGFFSWLKTGIERNLITDHRWKMIVEGLATTMNIAFWAQLFGTVLGCIVCFALTRKNRIIKQIGHFYCGFIQGTPIVVLLLITYYIIFGETNISNVNVAIMAFTFIVASSVGSNLMGAIETVDPVEIEAARSIGFSAIQAFLTVTFPQAVRRVLPSYTNSFVELVKSTAIVGYIAIQDLTRAGDIIRARTYDAYFPLLFIAVIYLLITTLCVQLFKLIVKKINGGIGR